MKHLSATVWNTLHFSVNQNFREDDIFVCFLTKELDVPSLPSHLTTVYQRCCQCRRENKRPQLSSTGSTAIRPPPPTIKRVFQLGHLDRAANAGPRTRNAPCSHTATASSTPQPSRPPASPPMHSSSRRQHAPHQAGSQRSSGMDKDEPMLHFSTGLYTQTSVIDETLHNHKKSFQNKAKPDNHTADIYEYAFTLKLRRSQQAARSLSLPTPCLHRTSSM